MFTAVSVTEKNRNKLRRNNSSNNVNILWTKTDIEMETMNTLKVTKKKLFMSMKSRWFSTVLIS